MKTLMVHFLPRGERSHTRQLLEAFRAALEGGEAQVVDLTKDIPDFFNSDNLSAYIQRNYLGQELSGAQQVLMGCMDRMAAQFREADRVVVAFPMHNFSEPAIVKAYFDSVMLKGVTWDMTDAGYQGHMTGKSACVLMASGGRYEGEQKAMEHAASLAETQLRFMGFSEVDVVTASGVNMDPEGTQAIIEDGCKRATETARKWNREAAQHRKPRAEGC